MFLGYYGLSAVCISLIGLACVALVKASLHIEIVVGGLWSLALVLVGALLISDLLSHRVQGTAFPRLPYAVLSALVFVAFYAIGMIIIAATGVGVLYTMPQWVAIGQLADALLHSIVTTPIDLRDDWYVIGTVVYALVGLGSGLILARRIPRRAQAFGLVVPLALFQVVIYASLLLLSLTGIYDPMKNF
jgi:hypothetical protein